MIGRVNSTEATTKNWLDATAPKLKGMGMSFKELENTDRITAYASIRDLFYVKHLKRLYYINATTGSMCYSEKGSQGYLIEQSIGRKFTNFAYDGTSDYFYGCHQGGLYKINFSGHAMTLVENNVSSDLLSIGDDCYLMGGLELVKLNKNGTKTTINNNGKIKFVPGSTTADLENHYIYGYRYDNEDLYRHDYEADTLTSLSTGALGTMSIYAHKNKLFAFQIYTNDSRNYISSYFTQKSEIIYRKSQLFYGLASTQPVIRIIDGKLYIITLSSADRLRFYEVTLTETATIRDLF